jgi:hypothetical protein
LNIERLKRFLAPSVIGELHSLCTSSPFVNDDGKRDFGWNCRFQAFVLGLALSADGAGCAVSGGKAAFVIGGEMGIDVDPHAWLLIEGHGMLDVSPTFTAWDEPFREWGSVAIVRNAASRSERLVIARSPEECRRAMDIAASIVGQRSVIYCGNYGDPLDVRALDAIAAIGNCPLLDAVISEYGESAVLAAARHIYNLARGRNQSLGAVNQDDAWKMLAERKYDDRAWFASRMRVPGALG